MVERHVMKCWQCGTILKVTIPEKESIRVQCSSCGKDLGLVHPRPKAPPILGKPTAGAGMPVQMGVANVPLEVSENAANPRVVDGSSYFGGICVTLLGATFLLIGGYYFWQTEEVLSTHRRTYAQLICKDQQATGRSGGSFGQIEFLADDGKTYQAVFYAARSMKIGTRIPVLYDPDNPVNYQADNFNSLYGFPSAFGGLGAVILIAGVFALFRKKEDNEKWEDQKAQDLAQFGSQFPHACAGCAKGKPTATYRVCGPTTSVHGEASTVHTTPFVEVPICAKCLWRIYRIHATVWTIAALVGIGGAIGILMIDEDIKTTSVWALLAGLFGLAITGVIGQVSTASWVSLGDLHPADNFVQFKNAAYQQLYENHVGHGLATAAKQPSGLQSLLGK